MLITGLKWASTFSQNGMLSKLGILLPARLPVRYSRRLKSGLGKKMIHHTGGMNKTSSTVY